MYFYHELTFDGYADAIIKVGTFLKDGMGIPSLPIPRNLPSIMINQTYNGKEGLQVN